MSNIPVRRNRNGPFHFNSNRNFRNLWHNGKQPRTQQTSYCVDLFRILRYFINTWKQLTSWKDISFCKIRCLNLNIILLTMDSLKQTGRKRHCLFVWHIDTGSVVWISYRQWQVSQSDREISSNCGKKATYSVHTKTQSQRFVVSRFLRFVERFWKAPFSWQISVDGRRNRRNKASFSWRISVDGRRNRRNKAPFSWRISVDGRRNRRNKAAFSNFSNVEWMGP